MKDRPILFSGPMVRAILDGSKTQTRRVVMPQPKHPLLKGVLALDDEGIELYLHDRTLHRAVRCPYGKPSDRLRVKEAAWMWCERRPNGKTKSGRDKWLYVPMREAPIHYAADHPQKPSISVVSPHTGNAWGWRLKIGRFLPAWAGRITLEVTGIRVERLQDISEADAATEGVSAKHTADAHYTAREAYAVLWEQINGPGSWDANPWVWVVEFRRLP